MIPYLTNIPWAEARALLRREAPLVRPERQSPGRAPAGRRKGPGPRAAYRALLRWRIEITPLRALSALGQKLRNRPAAESLDPAAIGIIVFGLKDKVWVELGTHSLYVMPRDYIGAAILQTKTHEPHVTNVIESELKRGDVFLDIGANLGFFTMLASRIVGEPGEVISFEPNPLNLQLIYASILRNAADNIRIYPYATSERAGILRFLTVGSNGGVMNDDDERDTSMLVQAVTLDEFLKDRRRIDLVKIDIEGHEISALKGMINLLRRDRPKIIAEFHPWAMRLNQLGEPEEYLSFLFDLKYRIAVIGDKGQLIGVSSPAEVMAYQSSLGDERIHIDLFEPVVLWILRNDRHCDDDRNVVRGLPRQCTPL